MLSQSEKPEFDRPASILYCEVVDPKPTYEALAASGAKAEQKPTRVAPMPGHDLWVVFFRDSENNPLALMAKMRKANRRHAGVPAPGAATDLIHFHA